MILGAATSLRLLKRGEEVISLDKLNSYYDRILKRVPRLALIEAAEVNGVTFNAI